MKTNVPFIINVLKYDRIVDFLVCLKRVSNYFRVCYNWNPPEFWINVLKIFCFCLDLDEIKNFSNLTMGSRCIQ